MLDGYGFIETNNYEWREIYNELKKSFVNDKTYENIMLLSGFIYWAIHTKFFNLGTKESEIYTRELVKYVISELLPFVVGKITECEKKIDRSNQQSLESLNNWLELEDDLYALASYRSLIHYALYMERNDAEEQKVWCYNLDECMGGVFFYANSMVLDKKYKSMIKQCPTGYGKSKSDCVIISFILGVDINSEIMKIVGNNKLVTPQTQNIALMIMSKRHGKVFPQFGKYEGTKDMFKIYTLSDGKFGLKDSKTPINFACYNKETPIDGTRFNYQFYDDITQSDDMENTTSHKRDWERYTNQWKKRQKDEFNCLRFFTGTAYHREDFISRIRSYMANNRPLLKCRLKTKWARYVKFSEDNQTVYVTVPKLADFELGEDKCYCTFPQRYSKQEALKMLHSTIGARRSFMAMEQQQPMPPESLAFDWIFMKQYKTLPQEIVDKVCDTIAIIDPSRFGRDNYACLIFKQPINDNEKELWYLTDCYYKQKSAKMAIPSICAMLSKHNVGQVYFESNTTDVYLMKKEIQSTLQKYGNTRCKVYDFYSTLKKEEKISYYRDEIRENIVIPQQGMYNPDSDMGRALSDITNYSFEYKNAHDDSIDVMAMLCNILDKKHKNEIEILNFRF